jgi:hypothetical protein
MLAKNWTAWNQQNETRVSEKIKASDQIKKILIKPKKKRNYWKIKVRIPETTLNLNQGKTKFQQKSNKLIIFQKK